MGKAIRKSRVLKAAKAPALPKGFKAAPPITSPKLRELLMGPDITTSGRTHTMVDGRPVLKREPQH